jgi:hypothetical protein
MTMRSALFVDFDNVYTALGGATRAGRLFAEHPGRWVERLERGGSPSGRSRRFLVKVCYLSPGRSEFRRAFVESGFRVVDCPRLTSSDKNSADIQLVMDALDALAADTRYDEFVIASADADFAPLLHRLRAHDRRTTVFRGGPAAPAYLALCDSVLTPEDLLSALAAPADTATAQAGRRRPAVPAQRGPAPGDVAGAVRAIRQLVSASPVPVPGSKAAQAARDACPELGTGWLGTGSFGGFVAEHLPGLRWTSQPAHGQLYDPARGR